MAATSRRAFLAYGAVFLAGPPTVDAQPVGKVYRLGYLSPAPAHNPIDQAFERAMKDLGYVEGANLRLERRYTAGRNDQLPSPPLSWFDSILILSSYGAPLARWLSRMRPPASRSSSWQGGQEAPEMS
jgi:hypothetical protein